MSHERQYIVEKFNVETILSMKYQLMEDQLLEPVLNTNLDYAARVIPHMPHAILSDATLCIAGEKGLVKLIPNKQSGLDSSAQPHHSKINLTVICNDGQPQLIRRVTCGDVITHSDVKDVHFSGHNCQDMVQSCYGQAGALMSRCNTKMLRIICNSLSLTYSAIDDAEDGQSRDMSAHGSALLLSKGYEPEPLAKYGTLDVAFDYDSGEQRLAVTVTAATDIPALRRTGNVSWQVHLVLLPTKQQRAKTGVQKGPCPVFTETFKFTCVESETIGSYAVRFRLYSVRRMRKERVMGEKVFYLTKLNLQGKMSVPVTLDPGCTLKQGCGSLKSVSCSEGVSSYRSAGQTSRPEILLGLLYSSTTGRLSVEVIKGSHFRDMAPGKPPNTYVKLTMMNSMGQEMSKCKTSTCRGRPDPMYKETFAFQVALFQLSEVTLLLSVYCRRGVKRRDRVGWVSLGLNSSGEAETSHWAQMREAEGQQVCRWLTLLDS